MIRVLRMTIPVAILACITLAFLACGGSGDDASHAWRCEGCPTLGRVIAGAESLGTLNVG